MSDPLCVNVKTIRIINALFAEGLDKFDIIKKYMESDDIRILQLKKLNEDNHHEWIFDLLSNNIVFVEYDS